MQIRVVDDTVVLRRPTRTPPGKRVNEQSGEEEFVLSIAEADTLLLTAPFRDAIRQARDNGRVRRDRRIKELEAELQRLRAER